MLRCSSLVVGLLFVGVGLAGCTKPASGNGTDSGSPIDAGPGDAGSPTDAGVDAGTPVDGGSAKVVGASCSQNAECASQQCYDAIPGGYCTQTCTDNTTCPSGSVCEEIGGGSLYCVQECTSAAACSAGNTCLGGGEDICVPTTGGCTADAGCTGTETCDTTTGFCSGVIATMTNTGAPCTSDTQCMGGRHSFCLPASDDFWGGYCSSYCRSDTSCGAGNQCVPGLVTGGSGQPIGLCLEGCSMTSDCRAQYNCLTVQDQSFCFPFCATAEDCLYPGQTCNPTTGLCSGGDTDGGFAMGDAGEPIDAGETDAGPAWEVLDAGRYEWDGGYPAPFPTPPQVLLSPGGAVLAAPYLVPIFFANDDQSMVTQIEGFISTVGSSSYWTAAVGEYGVGAATAAAPIMLNEIATGTLSDESIQQWLQSEITAQTLPAPKTGIIYVIHYPAAMTINLDGELSCQYFGGYHSDFVLQDGTDIAYAVLPRCQPEGSGTVIQTETSAESHELAEASTDPYPNTTPAYIQVDNEHLYWQQALGGSELGDMCAQSPGAFVVFPDFPYMVQRIWSNTAVNLGHDPCQPELAGEVYFNASPVQPDLFSANLYGEPTTIIGVDIAGGGSQTIPLDLYSDGPTGGPWSVQVESLAQLEGQTGTVNYTLATAMGQNGEQLSLQISPAMANPGNLDIFFVISSLGSNSQFWIGAVQQ